MEITIEYAFVRHEIDVEKLGLSVWQESEWVILHPTKDQVKPEDMRAGLVGCAKLRFILDTFYYKLN